MINKIFEYAKRPDIFKKCSAKFWDDEHISKEMLKCHLDPELDSASRRHDFIDKSVEWISMVAPANSYVKLLDLGCGPGVYAKRLSIKGYSVTGIDFSRRSIEYGVNEANRLGLEIEYIYKNYLEIEYRNAFDLALMICCDFGVLSYEECDVFLKKVYSALKTGGKFIFDVFTPKNYEGRGESNNWYVSEGACFWRAEPHMALESHYIYEDNVRLDQYIIVDNKNNVEVYNIWDHSYTREAITKLLNEVGFKNIRIYSDVAGKPFEENSKTMCIVAEK